MNEEDKKLADESLKEEANDNNISSEHTLTTVETKRELAQGMKGVAIAGMEEVPASFEAVPYLRLIQPPSKNIELDDGTEAKSGSFLFNDTQKAYDNLSFVLLKARHEFVKVDEKGNFVLPDYQGKTRLKQQIKILGYVLELEKLFVLSLSSTSFSPFGKLIAKLKEIQADKTWRFKILMGSEKRENDQGKYWIASFKIEGELPDEQIEDMERIAAEYGVVLNRQLTPEEAVE